MHGIAVKREWILLAAMQGMDGGRQAAAVMSASRRFTPAAHER